ncbi:MAG TPA: MFS transporter, partial [Thermomicrobiales bacterium]|nr:MFS transporter [Thermomicrobiales bacterium]
YLLTIVVFVTAAALVFLTLRPDPLVLARSLRATTGAPVLKVQRSIPDALRTIAAIPSAMLGFAGIVLGHSVMVAVMSMTPVHLHHGGGSLEIIGIVISLHIAGMYAFSPLVGMAADRYGRKPIIALGAGILLLSFLVAGTATGHQTSQLALGLILLGLGWSCTMIAGSTLLTDSIPTEQLPNVQGTSDVLMGFAGAGAGLLAGVIVGFGSYAILTIITTVMIVPLLVVALRMRIPAVRPTAA